MPTLVSVTLSCDPDRILLERPVVGVELEMIVIVVGILVVLVHDILAEEVVGEVVSRLFLLGIGHQLILPSQQGSPPLGAP